MNELLVSLLGYYMGGLIGFATIISAFTIGFCVPVVFVFLKFESNKVLQETITHTLKSLKA